MTVAKMRVFFVNRYFYPDESATSQLLGDLLFALAERGYDVHVICSRQLYGAPGASLAAEEQIRNIQVHRLWTTSFGRFRLLGRAVDYFSFYATCAVALVRRLRRRDILVAMTDPPLISIVSAIAARCKGASLINWVQDVFPEIASRLKANPLPSWVDRCLRRARDSSLHSARMNVLIGVRMHEFFASRGIPTSRTCVIDNWADANAIVPKDVCASTLRNRLSLTGKFVVCYSGNLGRAHDFATLLGAAEALRTEPSIVFLAIGGGFKMDQLLRAVNASALSSFHFLPYQPRQQLQDSLAASDVHIVSLLPELEGLIVPSKLYGILAAGRPIVFIGDPDGEVARIIRQLKCGFAVAVDAVDQLVSALRHLATESQTRLAMGVRARQALVDRYSLNQAVNKWIDVFENL